MALKVIRDRVVVIGQVLSLLSIDDVLAIEEGDPQFQALRGLYMRLGDCNATALLAVLNSLVSYQLSSKGEDYWMEFSRYSFKAGNPDDLAREFMDFLINSKGNKLLRDVKALRIKKFLNSKAHVEIYVKFHDLLKDLRGLREVIKRVLNVEGSEKTVVFAIKMFYYASRVCGNYVVPPMDIELPVDRRIAAVTYTSGIVDSESAVVIEEVMRNYKTVQKVWMEISRLSNIPPLNLDSIIWICGKYVRDEDRIDKAALDLTKYSKGRVSIKTARTITSELLMRRI